MMSYRALICGSRPYTLTVSLGACIQCDAQSYICLTGRGGCWPSAVGVAASSSILMPWLGVSGGPRGRSAGGVPLASSVGRVSSVMIEGEGRARDHL